MYILALEHFAVVNYSIQGIMVGQRPYHLSHFANDMLIYVTNPTTAFPYILHVLEQFDWFSNFKINFAKSRCLNITLSQTEAFLDLTFT